MTSAYTSSKDMQGMCNRLKAKCRLFYLKTQSVPRCKHPSCRLQKPVYAVSDTSRCLFSDKYKTHKYSVGREYNC
jgi:hypothetical protein